MWGLMLDGTMRELKPGQAVMGSAVKMLFVGYDDMRAGVFDEERPEGRWFRDAMLCRLTPISLPRLPRNFDPVRMLAEFGARVQFGLGADERVIVSVEVGDATTVETTGWKSVRFVIDPARAFNTEDYLAPAAFALLDCFERGLLKRRAATTS